MDPDASLSTSERTRALLEENLELSKRIYQSTERTRKYILWGQVLGVLKILIIMVPLVWGAVLLRPYLETAFKGYQDLLGITGTSSTGGSTNESLLQQLKNSGIDSKTLQQYLNR